MFVQNPEKNPCAEVTQEGNGVEALIFLRRRPIHDKTAILLSFLSRGVVLGWPMDPHNGRCLGQFLAVSSETESFGAAAVTDDNEFLITADSAGYIKVFAVAACNTGAAYDHLRKFKWRYLRGGSSDLLRVRF